MQIWSSPFLPAVHSRAELHTRSTMSVIQKESEIITTLVEGAPITTSTIPAASTWRYTVEDHQVDRNNATYFKIGGKSDKVKLRLNPIFLFYNKTDDTSFQVLFLTENLWPKHSEGARMKKRAARRCMAGVEIRKLSGDHPLSGEHGLFATQRFGQFDVVRHVFVPFPNSCFTSPSCRWVSTLVLFSKREKLVSASRDVACRHSFSHIERCIVSQVASTWPISRMVHTRTLSRWTQRIRETKHGSSIHALVSVTTNQTW
jgi:hypothetical protein